MTSDPRALELPPKPVDEWPGWKGLRRSVDHTDHKGQQREQG